MGNVSEFADSEWPERFVYVCSATKNAIVNIAPVAHAGFKRIARVVILCGAEVGSTSPIDRDEAINPALWLEQWFKDRQISVEAPVRHAAADAAPWGQVLMDVCKRAAAEGLPTVFNTQGGRTQMKIGALRLSPPDVIPIFVEGHPIQSTMIDDCEGPGVTRRLARTYSVTLDDYLQGYGLDELDRDERIASQRFYQEYASNIAAFAGVVIRGGASVRRALEEACNEIFPGGSFRGGNHSFTTLSTAARALQTLKGVPGLELADPGADRLTVRFTDAAVATVALRGGWLEAVLFNRLRSLVGDHSRRGSVFANLKLAERGQNEVWREADVALMIDDQFHVIEAKARRFKAFPGEDPKARESVKGARQKAVEQVADFKRRMLGIGGRAWIVNPLAAAGDVTPQLRDRVGQLAQLRLGPDAIDVTVRDITALMSRR